MSDREAVQLPMKTSFLQLTTGLTTVSDSLSTAPADATNEIYDITVANPNGTAASVDVFGSLAGTEIVHVEVPASNSIQIVGAEPVLAEIGPGDGIAAKSSLSNVFVTAHYKQRPGTI